MSSSGSVTSRLNRFEILLDEFCSEFDASDDDSSSSQRSGSGARFSLHMENRPAQQPRIHKSRTLSPTSVLRDIGQAQTSPQVGRRSKASTGMLQSPGCLKLSLSATLDQAFSNNENIGHRHRLGRQQRLRYASERRLLPIASAEPCTPYRRPSDSVSDDFHHERELSHDSQDDYSYFGHHRQNSSLQFSIEPVDEKNRSIAAILESHAIEDEDLETERPQLSPDIDYISHDAIHQLYPHFVHNQPQQSPEEQRQALLHRYNFTSDEDFYRDLRLPVIPRAIVVTDPVHRVKSTELGSPQQIPLPRTLRPGKSMPALRRKTSTLTLLSKEGLSPPVSTTTASLSLISSDDGSMQIPAATALLCKPPLEATAKSRLISSAKLESSNRVRNLQEVSAGVAAQPVIAEETEPSSRADESFSAQPQKRVLRNAPSFLWNALWRVPSAGDEHQVRRAASQNNMHSGSTVDSAENETGRAVVDIVVQHKPEAPATVAAIDNEASNADLAVFAEDVTSINEVDESIESGDPAESSNADRTESSYLKIDLRICDSAAEESSVATTVNVDGSVTSIVPEMKDSTDTSLPVQEKADCQRCEVHDEAESVLLYEERSSQASRNSAITSGQEPADASESTRPVLAKRTSWLSFPLGPASPTLESPTESSRSTNEGKSSVFGFRNFFKKRMTSDNYISFPTFSGSVSGSLRSTRSTATIMEISTTDSKRSPASATASAEFAKAASMPRLDITSWPHIGGIANAAISANTMCNPYSIIDQINAYRSQVDASSKGHRQITAQYFTEVECSRVDEAALRDALDSSAFLDS